MKQLIDDNGQLMFDDVRATVPAYRGPIPLMDDTSPVALAIRNGELNNSDLVLRHAFAKARGPDTLETKLLTIAAALNSALAVVAVLITGD